MKNIIYFLPIFLTGCFFQSKISVNFKGNNNESRATLLKAQITEIKFLENQLILDGQNLSKIKKLKLVNSSDEYLFDIQSNTDNKIIANSKSAAVFSLGKVFDLIIANSNASTTYTTINFSLCDSYLGTKGFNCNLVPNDKDVLSFDAISGKWIPRAVNGLSYQGLFDASLGIDPTSSSIGDYYIISVAGTINSVSYSVGDWIVLSSVGDWERINNSNLINSVYGRTGSVTASEGDYNLNLLSDVDLTTSPPSANQYLKYNGTQWIPASLSYSESDPLVSAFAKSSLPTCLAGEVLKSNGTSFSCVTDSTGAAAFSGTANRVVLTNGSGALSTSSISNTEINYLSGVSSNLQTQLGNKADLTNGLQTITALSVTGLSSPSAGSDAANKTYVDSAITSASTWVAGGSGLYYNTMNVGIGTSTPSQALEVNGTIKATDIILTSDRRKKYNIESLNLNDSFEALMKIRPVSFNWKNNDKKDQGVIAQEIRKIFPDFVIENPDHSLSVRYNSLMAPMIASIQHLEQKNKKLEMEMENLNKKMELLLEALKEKK